MLCVFTAIHFFLYNLKLYINFACTDSLIFSGFLVEVDIPLTDGSGYQLHRRNDVFNVFLFVHYQDYSKTCDQIFMKFYRIVGHNSGTTR